jgi:uncharacterized protein (DUF2252 family)
MAEKRAVPRSIFGAWTPPKDRDPGAVLREQERTRLPELLAIRHERMRASPFGFYRGAAAVQAADLAGLPLTGLHVQACGDAHLANFGAYASPERNIVFDVNDFDETLSGAWEWDVLRLAASVELVARARALGARRANETVLAAVSTYRNAVAEFARLSPLDVWFRHIDLANAARTFASRRQIKPALREAKLRTAEHLLPKITAGAPAQFIDEPPTFRRVGVDSGEAGHAANVLASYRASLPPHVRMLFDRFELRDVALKVVGVGSVGTRCFAALLLSERNEPLLLQLKEAEASVWEAAGDRRRSTQHGRRVVEGQHLIQAASDIFLGWTSSNGIDYYVRQLRNMNASVALGRLGPQDLLRYVRLCAWTLAHGHARSGDPVALAGYLGKNDVFDRSVAAFARTYADLTEADHRAFMRAAT